MSHTTAIKSIKIMDINALRAACTALAAKGINITLEEGGKPRAYYENQQDMGKADFVVRLRDAAYDIGLYKQSDGSYEARTDFHTPWKNGTSVEAQLGARCTQKGSEIQAKMGKLYAEYAAQAAIAKARSQGLTVQRVQKGDGVEKLVLTGFA